MSKSPDAFRTISEVAEDLDLPQHVLRFWETRFTQIKPMKRGGGRRYYRPDDVELLRGIRHLLYGEGYTIRGVQRILREQGQRFVVAGGRGETLRMPPRVQADDTVDDRDVTPEPVVRPMRRMDEIEPDDHVPDDEVVNRPPVFSSRPVAPVIKVREDKTGRLSGEVAARLKATLAELLECKRLLDQAR
jgi:DNA-binding transcriptional MerR regulator